MRYYEFRAQEQFIVPLNATAIPRAVIAFNLRPTLHRWMVSISKNLLVGSFFAYLAHYLSLSAS
jgi:hypothetical protein